VPEKAADRLRALTDEIVACRACPRLVEWRERVAKEKRAAFRDEPYWGRPVPGFGDPAARVLIAGLAPAAHGGNRTGRVFTGDRSGDWLFASMHRLGFANQPVSISADDGLELRGAYVAAAVRCAPPDNKPTPAERDRCLPYLERELALLDRVRVVVVLGGFAYEALARVLAACDSRMPVPRPKFAHGLEVATERFVVLGCYHPSQQNTFTGRLTETMIDDVFRRARELADGLP
jgi:uracil-DNA glycosylase family 4